jgi:hypothetical protein
MSSKMDFTAKSWPNMYVYCDVGFIHGQVPQNIAEITCQNSKKTIRIVALGNFQKIMQ